MTDQPKTIASMIEQWAQSRSDAVAIGAPGREPLTYGGLAEQARYTRSALSELGLVRNDPVAFVLPNGPEMVGVFTTIAASGVTTAPLNPAYREKEFDFYLSDLEAKLLLVMEGDESPARASAKSLGIEVREIVKGDYAGSFRLPGCSGKSAGSDAAQPTDVALVLHTSGTTARPKIVPLAHANLLESAFNVSSTLRLTPEDRCLNVMPLYHIHGLVGATMSSLFSGASIHCSPGYDSAKFFDWYREILPTWYTAVPTIHQSVLAAGEAHRALFLEHPLRFIRSSSSPLSPSTMQQLEALTGAPIVESYGMTEAAHQMTSNQLPPGTRKPGTVGPAAGPEVAIANESGEFLATGTQGEIVIRGPSVTAGYRDNEEANKKAFFADGWFRTGDVGFIDDDGYLTICARIKEQINRGGEKISPREVDDALLEHQAVAEAVTFAVAHDTLGEDVCAAVVLKADAMVSSAELRSFLGGRVADFKVPQQVLIVDGLPKGATGKVQRIGMAKHFADQLNGMEVIAPTTPLQAALLSHWRTALQNEDFGITDNYFSLGGDSLTAAVISAQAAQDGVFFSPHQLLLNPTVEQLAADIGAGDAEVAPLPEPPPSDRSEVLAPQLAAVLGVPVGSIESVQRASQSQQDILFTVWEGARNNLQSQWVVTGALDADVLRRALEMTMRELQIMRTAFFSARWRGGLLRVPCRRGAMAPCRRTRQQRA